MKLQILLIALSLTCSSLAQMIHMPIMQQEKNVKADSDVLVNLRGSALPSASVENSGNTIYSGLFQIGSSQTPLHLTLDTGSAVLWLSAPNSTASTSKIAKFDCSGSKTCVPTPTATVSTTYVDGSGFFGYQITDQVQYGSIVLPQFGMSYSTNSGTADSATDGIMGLSPIMTKPVPFPVALKQAGITGSSTFSIYLGQNAATLGGKRVVSGEITFGGVDPNIAAEDFRYLPLTANPNQWRVSFQGVGVGGTTPNVAFSRSITVIFDTGNSGALLPSDLIQAIGDQVKAVSGSTCTYSASLGKYQCDCTLTSPLPDLIFYLGGQSRGFNIPSAAYFKKNSAGQCYLAFTLGGQASINLGDTFLKYYYAVFSYEDQTVGLALAKTGLTMPVSAI